MICTEVKTSILLYVLKQNDGLISGQLGLNSWHVQWGFFSPVQYPYSYGIHPVLHPTAHDNIYNEFFFFCDDNSNNN